MTASLNTLATYVGLRVTVLGLGSFGGGVAVARFLAKRGAVVTVTDMRSEVELADSLTALADVNITRFALNGHPDDAFADCQMLVVNPAVKPSSPILQRCRQTGTIVTSEIELFLHHCRARVVGITGSNGKSTTAALTHHFLADGIRSQTVDDAGKSNCGPIRRVFLGGNIGNSLLPDVDDITDHDVVVLELSSFQLHYLAETSFAPAVAIVTNFAANHLDWHGDVATYHAAKQVLLNRQAATDIAILPDDCIVNQPALPDEHSAWRVRSRCLRFGVVDGGEDGVFLEDGLLIFRNGRAEDVFRISPPQQLPGVHNAKNIAAAACAALSLGTEPTAIIESLPHFTALPHRLQLVASGHGRKFYNDSVATTPESAIAALQTFNQPVVIIAGGSDKGADLNPLADAIAERAAAAVLIGQTASTLEARLKEISSQFGQITVVLADDFPEAFLQAVSLCSEGGIVLLSPGCASFGWFKDFRDRGEQFTKLAEAWGSQS